MNKDYLVLLCLFVASTAFLSFLFYIVLVATIEEMWFMGGVLLGFLSVVIAIASVSVVMIWKDMSRRYKIRK